MTIHFWLALVFNGVLFATCGYALVRGGRPERIGAGINISASGITTILRIVSPRFFAPAELTIMLIDLAVLGSFYWLAVTTTRYWPVWAFGFALADVVISLAGGLLSKVPLFAFHTGLGIYAYLALAALALGTFKTRRPQATQGLPDFRGPPLGPPRSPHPPEEIS